MAAATTIATATAANEQQSPQQQQQQQQQEQEQLSSSSSSSTNGVVVYVRNNSSSSSSNNYHSASHSDFIVERRQRVHGINEEGSKHFYALSENGAYMLCCGFWDNSFRILNLEEDDVGGPAIVQKIIQHKDLVTCICFAEAAGIVATGSRDTRIMLWAATGDDPVQVEEHPRSVLYGHNDEVIALDVNAELDIVASCAKDGCLMVHTICSGSFVWSAQVDEPGSPATLVKISPANGDIVAYASARSELLVFNVNGRLLSAQKCGGGGIDGDGEKDDDDAIYDMQIVLDGDVLVTCGPRRLCFWRLCDMKICFSTELESPGRCIHVSNDETIYYIGMENGKVLVLKA